MTQNRIKTSITMGIFKCKNPHVLSYEKLNQRLICLNVIFKNYKITKRYVEDIYHFEWGKEFLIYSRNYMAQD